MKVTKVIKKELKYLNSFLIEYETIKGKKAKWEMVSRQKKKILKDQILNTKHHTDGTQIVAYNKAKNTVILIKEYRPIHNGYIYSFPAGLKDNEETPFETAIREFKEETGLILLPKYLKKARYTSVGLTDEKVNTVYGEYSGEISDDYTKGHEDIKAYEITKEKAIYLLEKKEVPIRTALILEAIFGLNEVKLT